MPVAIDAPTRSGSRATSTPESCLGLARRREDHLREAIHPARRLAVDPLRRIEVLQLAGEVHVVGRARVVEAP